MNLISWKQFPYSVRKAWMVMRITTLLILVTALHLSAKTSAQKVTLSSENISIEEFFKLLKKQTGYSFLLNYGVVSNDQKISVHVTNADLEDVLTRTLTPLSLSYKIEKDFVYVIRKSTAGLQPVDSPRSAPAPADIHGRVTDSLGAPLVGASITVKSRKGVGAVTDKDGFFTLKNIAEDASLIISYTGYEPRELKLNGKSLGNIVLSHSNSPLDEVQVIAYGTTTSRLSTGNVTTISSKDIQNQPVNNPLLALEGRAPGLFITQASGVPGTAVTAQIQGQNSIANGNDPLYVVDGVPYISQMLPGLGGGILGYSGVGNFPQEGNPLNYINTSDIESISVLKDADATSIYGSRAANGAILITTKKGKIGQTKVDVNLQNGFGKVTRTLDLLNTPQYLAMRHEAITNDGLTVDGGPYAIYGIKDYDLDGLWDTTRNTNWQKTLIGKSAQYSTGNITVSGGNTSTQYLVGGTYHRETNVFPGDFADTKWAMHYNINNVSANKRFHLQLSGSYLADNNALPAIDLTYYAARLAPDAPKLYNADGTLNWEPNSAGNNTWTNPLAYNYVTYSNKTDNLIGNAVLKYELLPGLEARSNIGYTKIETNENNLNSSQAAPPSIRSIVPRTALYAINSVKTWIVEPQLIFKHSLLGGKLESLLGTTFQEVNSNGLQLQGTGYNSDEVLANPQAAASIAVINSIVSSYKYNAVFGRVNYNFADKYIINVGLRDDGSSRFGSANQFHTFWSVGTAWIFSGEPFIKKELSFLSFGKLRASYGTIGNDQIGDYGFLTLYNNTYSQVAYQGVTGLQPAGLPNPHLEWEETKKAELGLDLGFFKDRILLNANYYDNRSSNQLLSYSLPITTGFTNETRNFPATVRNYGWELSVVTSNIKGRHFTWTTRINLTIPKNSLISFPGISTSSYASSLVVGKAITDAKVYTYAGVSSDTGIYQFRDSKGTLTLNPDTTSSLVNLAPKYYGGIENSFSFKGFELDFLFQFVKQLGPTYYYGYYPGNFNGGLGNQPTTVLDRWQQKGDVKPIEKYNSNFALNGAFFNLMNSNGGYSDASFIRLKNISLSWNFPGSWVKGAHLQNARFYVLAQNLLTFTPYKGMDPRAKAHYNCRCGSLLSACRWGFKNIFNQTRNRHDYNYL